MNSVGLRAGAERRRHWRGWLFLALVVGLLAGGLIAAVGGARRIESAYDRFSSVTRAADVGFVPDCMHHDESGLCDPPVDPRDLETVESVADLALAYAWSAPVTTADGAILNPGGDSCYSGKGELNVVGSSDPSAERFNRMHLAEGRDASADRVEEAVLTLTTARRGGVEVGDELLLYIHRSSCEEPADWGVPTRVRVVGIGQTVGEVPTAQGFRVEGVHVSAALAAELVDDQALEPPVPFAVVQLATGRSTADLVREAKTLGISPIVVFDAPQARRGVAQRVAPDAAVLWLVAAIGGLAAVVVLGSTVAQIGRAGAGDADVLRCLGWRRRDFAKCAAAGGALIGLAAAAVAVALAVVASKDVMLGEARDIDPDRGLRIDTASLVVGAATVLAVTAAAFVAGRLGGWSGSLGRGGRRRWSYAVPVQVRGLPASAVFGVRLAIAPSLRGSVPFWRGVAGLTFALVGLVASLTFLAGVDHLVATPRLAGMNWDAMADLGEERFASPTEVDAILRSLRADPRVLAASTGTYFPPFSADDRVTVGDPEVQIFPMSFSVGPKAVHPTVVDGRAPEGADEILLNPLLARRLELSVGDEVEVQHVFADGSVEVLPFELVGTGVLPVGDGQPATGAAVTLDGIRRLAPGVAPELIYVDLAERVPADAVLSEVGVGRGDDFLLELGVGGLLGINVTRSRQGPIVLAVILGLMAVGVLAHLGVGAVRSRSRDLAVSRALGFRSRDVRRSVTCMVALLGGASLLVAVPIGVVAGRLVFTEYADRAGAKAEAAWPVWGVVGLLPGLLLVAFVVSVWAGRRATSLAPTDALRTDRG